MPASKERQAQVKDWIAKNEKLLKAIDWNQPPPLRSSVLNYHQRLVYQTLLRDGLYSDKTEAFDALRSFRQYVLAHQKQMTRA